MLDRPSAGSTESGTASTRKIVMLRSDNQNVTSRAPITQFCPNQSRCIST